MGKRIGFFRLVNYKDHPANEMYKVLNFNSQAESDMFEEKLKEGNFFYEKDVEEENGVLLYLFAVRNRDFKSIQQFNFEVSAAFRSPMIKNKSARYTLIAFFLAIMSVALVGYFKSMN
ncbi:MAG: hypothetical protein AB8B72_04230 [Crocinitomicaceae bacterium]